MAYNFGRGLSGGISGAGAGSAMGPWGAAAGGALGLLQGFGGDQNPSDAASKYYDQMPDTINKGYDPWISAGQNLMAHPGERVNEIGAGYHQSPGFKFALQQALQGAGHAAAAGGMAGSPQHEQQNMGIATGLADQDYNQFMQNALGLHNLGYTQGQSAGIGKSQDLASILAHRAQLAYEGQNTENQQQGGMWGSVFGGLQSLGQNREQMGWGTGKAPVTPAGVQ